MKATLKTLVIVGRPNVGKSLLFNRLLRRRQALVHNTPGMTLDYLCERLVFDNGGTAWLTDTGGMLGEEDEWTPLIRQQTERANEQADGLIVVVDAKTGCLPNDMWLVRELRRRWNVPLLLVVNKSENLSVETACADFHELGISSMCAVSAKSGGGIATLMDTMQQRFEIDAAQTAALSLPTIAVVGRPNVGKSVFVNRLLKDKRMIVSERPGTTRDAVTSELRHPKGSFLLIDTAGMKRQRATAEREKISVATTRNTLARSDVAILIFDLSVGATYQDRRIAAMLSSAGRPFVVVGNKVDLLPKPDRASCLKTATAALLLGNSAHAYTISALKQRSLPVASLLSALSKGFAATNRRVPTAKLNQILGKILLKRAPKRCGAIRPKLRYAHQGGNAPLCIVLHGNAVNRIDDAYKRYLEKAFARELSMDGAPLKVVFRSENNPYV